MHIMYELWLTCILSELDREVDFEFLIPKLFDTSEAAEKAQNDFYVIPSILEDGEIVFNIYGKNLLLSEEKQKDLLIDTICWTDYKKYNCIIMKKEGAMKTFGELFPEDDWAKTSGLAKLICTSENDYEPCAKKFERIYENYLTCKDISEICKHKLHCVAYEVKPIRISNM